MYCAKCGSQIPDGARFCTACGAPTAEASQPNAFTGEYGVPYSGTPRQIVRPREGRMVAGVCLGIANHMGWDVTIVRIVLVVLVFGAGTGVLAYLIGWVVIPEEPYGMPPGTVQPPPPPGY